MKWKRNDFEVQNRQQLKVNTWRGIVNLTQEEIKPNTMTDNLSGETMTMVERDGSAHQWIMQRELLSLRYCQLNFIEEIKKQQFRQANRFWSAVD